MCERNEASPEVKQLKLLIEQLQAKLAVVCSELEASQEKAAHLEAENGRLRYELNELKQAPFKSKKRQQKAAGLSLPWLDFWKKW